MSPETFKSSSSKSYSSRLTGPTDIARELANLASAYTGRTSVHVAAAITRLRQVERMVKNHTGLDLRGLHMLDVGAGQRLQQMRYFASHGNDVVGIDRDVIAEGLDVDAYVRMVRTNGSKRFMKTVGRKALGVDARYRAELRRQLGTSEPRPRLRVYQMDAAHLGFAAGRFDFAYSLAVFMHLEDPWAVAAEMARVLRPGGVAYVDLMLYTGPHGCLDIRLLGDRPLKLPPYAHLRPEHRHLVRENSVLNRFRLDCWRELFNTTMPGHVMLPRTVEHPQATQTIERLRHDGALSEYTDEELLTTEISIVWQKPAA